MDNNDNIEYYDYAELVDIITASMEHMGGNIELWQAWQLLNNNLLSDYDNPPTQEQFDKFGINDNTISDIESLYDKLEEYSSNLYAIIHNYKQTK